MALRVHQSASAAQAKQYFSQALARPDYYARGGESPGVWFGRGADRLGLAGAVTRDAFVALLQNRHPGTGDRLTARDAANRRVGWDLTFSPPKAVSVLRAFGDERVGPAFDAAVKETLAEVERDAVRTRVRRGGRDDTAPTGNLVAALFTHDTTRALADGVPDPHDHVHAYVLNATWAPDEGRWQAAELADAHRDRPYYEAAFEARLAGKLAALGYAIEPAGRGSWTVAGVPPAVLDTFSRRTAEIDAEAARRGVTDPDRKADLGAKTRRAKGDPLPAAALRAAWDARLTADERVAVAATIERAVRGHHADRPAGPTAGQSLDHAVAHHFERESAVGEKRLLETALRYAAGAVTPEALARGWAARADVLTAEVRSRRLATTRAAVAQERAVVRFARDGRGRCDPLGGYGPHAPRRADLNAGQRAAVRHLLGSFDRVAVLSGKAGVGKSTLLAEVRDGIEAAGRPVLAVAPTTAATGVLAADGFRAATVARLLADDTLQAGLAGGVLLVDEAGLVGVPTMKRLFDVAEARGARVVLSGDTGQHRGVERGAALRLLEERAGVRPAVVTEILRQRGRLKDAVAALARGDGPGGFDRLDALGMVAEVPDAGERYRTLAREYADALAAGKEALAVAPTHAEGATVTAAIRNELRTRGRLGADDHAITRLEATGLTEAERRDARNYRPGDVVRFHQNATGGWRRGEQVTVAGPAAGGLAVRTAAGDERTLPFDLAARFQAFRPADMRVAAGDRVRFTLNTTAPDGRRLDNGVVATVAGFTPAGDLVLDGGRVVPRDHGHLAPGWAVTSHAAQGRTVKGTVFVAQSAASLPAASREQFYVSASRAREAVRVFTDDKAALRDAVVRSDRPASATEVAGAGGTRRPPPWSYAAVADRLRRLRYLSAVRDRLGGPPPVHHTPARAAHERR